MAIIERVTEKEIRELMQIELSRRCKDASSGSCTSLLIDEDTCTHVPVEKCPQKMALLKKRKIELPTDCRKCKYNGIWVINPCNRYNCYESECERKRVFDLDVIPDPDSFLFKFCCWHARVFSPKAHEDASFAHKLVFAILCWIFGAVQVLLCERASGNFSPFTIIGVGFICFAFLPKIIGFISTPVLRLINIYEHAENLVSKERIEYMPAGTLVFGFLLLCLEVAIICRAVDLLKG